ncbi:hypothetical protein J21TS7_01450 [Paenibacillus cineris]|uniref:Uncharacterized protein n=1 Tax=Paenibacillus cineris TaxID=237530 RepID=A0ABQ4L6E2_9BACL|nr:hypothetical protein J21TS7_01450 [Paenibacillus cineris]
MKLIGLILLGCVISYILVLLGQVGFIIGVGLFIGFFLRLYLMFLEIRKEISRPNNNS